MVYKRDVVNSNLRIYSEVVEQRVKRFQVLYLDERIHSDGYVVMQKYIAI